MVSQLQSPKVCQELLMKELETPITNSKRAYRIIERLASCFLAFARDVHNITIELYGNGTPGGMKLDMQEIKSDIVLIKEHLGVGSSEMKFGRRKEDNTHLDTFDSILKWFSDKVLPSLVIGLLISAAQLVVSVIALMTAIGNGWLSIN